MTIKTPTGTLRTITPGTPWRDAAWHWTGSEDAATLARFGYVVQPDPPTLPTEPAIPTPKRYSKYKLVTAMLQAGVLTAFLQWLDSDRIALALWDAATELSETDGSFVSNLPKVFDALGVTQEQVQSLLDAAEIGAA